MVTGGTEPPTFRTCKLRWLLLFVPRPRHHELVKLLADWLLLCASLLSVVAALLGIVTLPDRRRYEGLTLRARFVAENRRHPRARLIQLACLTAAFVLLITVLLIIAPALSRFIYL